MASSRSKLLLKRTASIIPRREHELARLASAVVCLIASVMVIKADLLVAIFNNNGRVLRYNEHTGQYIDTFVGLNNGGLDLPHGLTYGPDGNLYVASANNNSVLRYNGTNGAFIDAFVTNRSGGLGYSVWVEFRGSSLYVSSQLGNEVLRYNATNGAFLGPFVSTNNNGGINGPSGMTWGPDGHLYVAGRFSSNVMKYDGTNGAFIKTFVTNGIGGLAQPFGCHFGPDGNLYVVSGNNNKVARFNGTNGNYLGDFVTNSSGGLSFPVGLEFGPDGNLYVASLNSNRVVRFSGTNGAPLGDFVLPGNGLSAPNFMLFHDFGPPRIDSIRRAGTNVVISWSGRNDTQLQSKTNLVQLNWQNVAGTLSRSSITNGASNNAAFYRLIRD